MFVLRSNFTDEEIDMFMSKYGINTYAYYFDPEELDRIMTDLEYREFEAFSKKTLFYEGQYNG